MDQNQRGLQYFSFWSSRRYIGRSLSRILRDLSERRLKDVSKEGTG